MRVWLTEKKTDMYFIVLLTISFFLFLFEILVASISIDDYKYSFFFHLDIIATLSLINDIPWMFSILMWLTGGNRPGYNVDAVAGVMFRESIMTAKIQQVVKSIRLIRLIRIIKLYKYVVVSLSAKKD